MKSSIKTFPLVVNKDWLDRLGKAVDLSDCDSKYDFIIKATEEKMRQVEKDSVNIRSKR